MKSNQIFFFLTIITLLFIETAFSQVSPTWIWISGANTTLQRGIYGTKGIANPINAPGARDGSVSWIDSSDNLWLFGGNGYDYLANRYLNDLWKFDRVNWIWISGSNTENQNGTYGTKGIASSSNVPSSRQNPVSWIDLSENLWLFGGYGYAATGGFGELNDLWKFNGMNWTWISGANTTLQKGTYGTKGIASSSNIPGARRFAVSWIDLSDNLWLFGGFGYDATGIVGGYLNDLWKFDGVNWTWISGANTINQNGNYGIQGIANSSNVPGGRTGAVSWIDSSGNFWLFGGYGYAATGNSGWLNDLWKFDGTYWTWISGSNSTNERGNYGIQGIASSLNIPGAGDTAVSWIDSNNNLWLFGGYGYAPIGNIGYLNGLWRFDGFNWTWISGANTTLQRGIYGTKGTASSLNVPGARGDAVSWIDSSNNLWLFGGTGYAYNSTWGPLNDLWKFEFSPVSSLTSGSLTSNSLTTSITSTTTGGNLESGTSKIRTTSIIFIIVGILVLIV